MPVNQQFLSARSAERTHRDLAHVRALCWIPLSRAGRTFARTPLVPLTLRHQLEFRLASNAFFSRRRPALADVFLLLWRLHPAYRAPQIGAEDIVARLASRRCRFLRLWVALGSFRAALVHRRLTALIRRCDLSALATSLYTYLALIDQDMPGLDAEAGPISHVAPDRSFADNLCDWLMTTYAMSHAEALDFPLTLGNQLHRERQLQQPEGELNVFAPSDLLL